LRKALRLSALLATLLALTPAARADDARQAFLTDAFPAGVPAPAALWLTGDKRARVGDILGHPPNALRVRYWAHGGRSAWILEEIGKERPITVGVVVADGRIDQLQILVYRESRGGEVAAPFFTRQFRGAGLAPGGEGLDRHIDSISGATLSVGAVKRVAREALYLAALIETPANSHDDSH